MDRVAPATQRMRAGRLAVRSCCVLLVEGTSAMAPLHCIRHHQLGCFAFARNDGVGDCPTGFVALNG